jgi:hypothetical protein
MFHSTSYMSRDLSASAVSHVLAQYYQTNTNEKADGGGKKPRTKSADFMQAISFRKVNTKN